MANRRRKGRAVSGWLALDKPVGRTSTHILSEVKRLFGAAKAGHAGTLDPLASGCLPIAFGEATKTVPYVMDGRKVYRFVVRWGVETDTDDAEGRPVASSELRPTPEATTAALAAFTGEIEQVPPAFSAIKIDGERAYDLARAGEAPAMEPRAVVIHRLEFVSAPSADEVALEAECGKGTYVRALARDLARALGARGHVTALRRLAVGPFDEAGLVPLEALRAAFEEGGPPALDRFLRPIETALGELPEIRCGKGDAERLLAGQSVLLRGRDAPVFSGEAFVTAGGRLLAIGEVERGEFAPHRVFHASSLSRDGGSAGSRLPHAARPAEADPQDA